MTPPLTPWPGTILDHGEEAMTPYDCLRNRLNSLEEKLITLRSDLVHAAANGAFERDACMARETASEAALRTLGDEALSIGAPRHFEDADGQEQETSPQERIAWALQWAANLQAVGASQLAPDPILRFQEGLLRLWRESLEIRDGLLGNGVTSRDLANLRIAVKAILVGLSIVWTVDGNL